MRFKVKQDSRLTKKQLSLLASRLGIFVPAETIRTVLRNDAILYDTGVIAKMSEVEIALRSPIVEVVEDIHSDEKLSSELIASAIQDISIVVSTQKLKEILVNQVNHIDKKGKVFICLCGCDDPIHVCPDSCCEDEIEVNPQFAFVAK